MEVECHMLPEGNRSDWQREMRTALRGEEEEEEEEEEGEEEGESKGR